MKDILAGVRAFKAHFVGTRIEVVLDEERPSVKNRLAQVDELLADGVISPDEHAQQRAHILDEM